MSLVEEELLTTASRQSPPDLKRGSLAMVALSPSVLRLLRPEVVVEGVPFGQGGGGAELQVTRIGRALAARGWEVRFVIKDWGQTEAEIGEGIRIINAHNGHRSERGARGFVTHVLPRYWGALGRADADIYLHRGLNGFAGLSGLFCRRHRRHLVLSLASNMDVNLPGQGPLPNLSAWERPLSKYAKGHASLTIAQTTHQEMLYAAQYSPRCIRIPNMVDIGAEPEEFEPEPVVLWAGSIRAYKRPEMVLEVARRLPGVRFAMAGGPVKNGEAYFDELRQQAAPLGNVDMLGWVPQDQMRQHYERAWALLMTSPPDLEGFPNVLLQAWERGRPTVSSFGPDHIIEEQHIGSVAQTVDEMVEGLSVICGDAATARDMGRRARNYVIENHAPEVIADRYDAALASLL